MNLTISIKSTLLRRCLAFFALATGCVTVASAAVTWQDVQFGGFASQGYLKSSANDYLGDTSGGTFDFREYAANASWSKDKFRVGAQAFGQKIGDYGKDEIKLDWATVDYQATQWFGVRAGRVKMPRGLYNEALDLDSVRPFVLLPQSVYDPRLRDFNASFDGGMVYGNVELGRFGSIDYRGFYGDIPIKANSGANAYFNSDKPQYNLGINLDSVVGGSLFWNTPLAGLRTGYSFSQFKNLTSLRSADPRDPLNLHTKTAARYPRHLFSAEYIWGDWTFASEYSREQGTYVVNYLNRVKQSFPKSSNKSYYVSAARRINKWLEVGAYYDSYTENTVLSTGVQPPKKQKDYALSLRFDLNEHVIFKLEGHAYDGAGKIFDTVAKPQPQSSLDQKWTMIAAKTTFSF